MMIEIKNLSFSYGKKKQSVFNDFSLTLDKGSVYGLLGKNGTGKSTLLYLMTGLLRPQAGQVLYKGVDVSMRYPLTLQDMFLVPEEFALPSVSLKRYLKLNTPFYPNFSNELLNACLHDFDMNEDIHLGELSMGQKKKVFMCSLVCFAVETADRTWFVGLQRRKEKSIFIIIVPHIKEKRDAVLITSAI